MTNELIDHLIETKNALDNPAWKFLTNHDKTQNYLYFATHVERMNLNMAEKTSNGVLRPNQVFRDLKKEQGFELIRLKPIFEAEAKNKGLVTINDRNLTIYSFENELVKLRVRLRQIEQSKGIFAALLELKEQAHYPDNTKGSSLRSRVAASYIQVIAGYLNSLFKSNDALLSAFLEWYGDRNHILLENGKSSEIKKWGFTKEETRKPPESARPIHESEVATYVKHFLSKASDPDLKLYCQYAEMTIFLAICLAISRRGNNYCDPRDILNISDKNLILPSPIKAIEYIDRTELVLSESKVHFHGINLGDNVFVISPRLAKAIKLLTSFSIDKRAVENRLNDAYKEIGLSQSTGGICPRCFLFRPHIREKNRY